MPDTPNTPISPPDLDLRRERYYANEAHTWSHGEKTEDELLQRIWNLSEVVLKACDEIARHRLDAGDYPEEA